MTLDEAIMHCMDIAETQEMCSNGKKCAKEHRQLAEWLKELKDLRSLVAYAEDFNLKIPKARLYKKASDEFIGRMTKEEE